MSEQEKQELLVAISEYFPYGVICKVGKYKRKLFGVDKCSVTIDTSTQYKKHKYLDSFNFGVWDIKPYLRPLSSMTEEEQNECINLIDIISSPSSESDKISKIIDCLNENIQLMDWFNKHHFDYRGLIDKGLALEAPEEMYKF